MKTLLYIFLALPLFMTAQPTVFKIEPEKNGTVSYSGNLSDGVVLDNLSWAWSSQNACFPETQRKKFTGSHVFFEGIIPTYSEMEVTVVPKDPKANFSIYAYQTGTNNEDLTPNLARCIRCEADHKRERNRVGRATQDHTRTVTNLVAINRPYRVVIVVVGAEGLTEGDFTLNVAMKSR
ncbi:hypothetical protein [Patiriisocius hiemis]|uniref:Uncharacterized protein n=1 Tax=Patiriisocius hiemis TaxID=3075604 RepID=A0ABU2YD49_9FLAO|nr:hypothetical protein [Constantimarinum sp. W242]MDT0556083.1 hypothetical protein [Constantimarinum sp. W242]